MDDANYQQYICDNPAMAYGVEESSKGTVFVAPPGCGYWNVIVNYGLYTGRLETEISVVG